MSKAKKAAPKTTKQTLGANDERWLHFYRHMLKIPLVEEEVNQLYLGAKMPGLAHLYIGQEAVAVGVCEALRQEDYITSTHRGHGHCLRRRQRGYRHRRRDVDQDARHGSSRGLLLWRRRARSRAAL